MLKEKSLLMMPGPTPVPPRVTAAMSAPMISHRSADFTAIFAEVAVGLQQLFGTKEHVYVLPGSGSGGWETALQNFVQPGRKVLAVITGDFGERWARAAAALGYDVERLDFAWGTAAEPAKLARRLSDDLQKEIGAVLLTHNETSTAVTNPIAELAAAVRAHGALCFVDSVSGMGAIPLPMDALGLDVVLTGAQKALMLPPGLTILAASNKAWQQSETVTGPRFFFDLRPYRQSFNKQQTPYTPALSLYYGLRESLCMQAEEGYEAIWARHRLLGSMCRAGVKAADLELLVSDEAYASATVTAVKVPADIKVADIRRLARNLFGVQLAAGQGPMTDEIFRIGHMGYITPNDVIVALAAVEMALIRLGHPVQPGRAAAAAQQVWLQTLEG